jgi:hypothetical protein
MYGYFECNKTIRFIESRRMGKVSNAAYAAAGKAPLAIAVTPGEVLGLIIKMKSLGLRLIKIIL